MLLGDCNTTYAQFVHSPRACKLHLGAGESRGWPSSEVRVPTRGGVSRETLRVRCHREPHSWIGVTARRPPAMSSASRPTAAGKSSGKRIGEGLRCTRREPATPRQKLSIHRRRSLFHVEHRRRIDRPGVRAMTEERHRPLWMATRRSRDHPGDTHDNVAAMVSGVDDSGDRWRGRGRRTRQPVHHPGRPERAGYGPRLYS